MHERPLAAAADPHRDRLHHAAATGGAVAGLSVQVDAVQAVRAVVAVLAAGSLQGHRPAAVGAREVAAAVGLPGAGRRQSRPRGGRGRGPAGTVTGRRRVLVGGARVVPVAADQLAVAHVAGTRDRAVGDGAADGAPGLVHVRAVAEAAPVDVRRELREPGGERRRVAAVHAEPADARRVDHADAAGQVVERGRRGGVAAAAVAVADGAGAGRAVRAQRVEQRRLADAALTDEHAGLPGERRTDLGDPVALPGAARQHREAEGPVGLQACEQLVPPALVQEVGLVDHEDGLCAGLLHGHQVAVDEPRV